MTERASGIVQEAIDVAIGERGEIGVQVAAYLDSELVIDQWGGQADETSGQEVDGDTLFQVFSNVKAVTATALHIQAERGLVDYYQPVAKYWPEFGKHGKDKGTVFDALTHRIGVPLMPVGVTPELMCDWDWMVGQLADMHPLFEPGTRSGYMAYTFGWVVGESCAAPTRSTVRWGSSSRMKSASPWVSTLYGPGFLPRWSREWPSSPTFRRFPPALRGCPRIPCGRGPRRLRSPPPRKSSAVRMCGKPASQAHRG